MLPDSSARWNSPPTGVRYEKAPPRLSMAGLVSPPRLCQVRSTTQSLPANRNPGTLRIALTMSCGMA